MRVLWWQTHCVTSFHNTQLADSTCVTDFKEMLDSDEYSFRFSCGVSKPTARIQFSDKQKVIAALCLHYTVMGRLAELGQLRRWLAIQKFNYLRETNPHIIRKAFQPPATRITSDLPSGPFYSRILSCGV